MNPPKNAGFTLIELLVVIAIIGILMGLVFSVGPAVLDMGRKTSARNDVTQIAAAVAAYEAEYGRLPTTATTDATTDVGGETLTALLGSNDDGLNPREIVFIEPNEYRERRGGVDFDANLFQDPWGNAYQIMLDADYDNTLDSPGNEDSTIRKRVAVWSENDSERREVYSWK